jgi:hypothetical protein
MRQGSVLMECRPALTRSALGLMRVPSARTDVATGLMEPAAVLMAVSPALMDVSAVLMDGAAVAGTRGLSTINSVGTKTYGDNLPRRRPPLSRLRCGPWTGGAGLGAGG